MLWRLFVLGGCFFIPIITILLVDLLYGFPKHLWYIDNVSHLLGGIFAGFVGLWWGLFLFRTLKLSHALLGAFFLGASVELLQYATGTGLSPYLSVPVDVTKDTVLDLFGGYVAWRLVRRKQ